MTLNKEQKQVLSRKIATELKVPIKKDNSLSIAIKKVNDKRIKINKEIDTLNELQKTLNLQSKYAGVVNTSKICLISTSFQSDLRIGDRLKEITSDQIYDDLVLTEIECKDLSDLIKKVKDKYK